MSDPAQAFDLPAYLARVGCGACPGVADLHRAHASMIPFENLDPHRGEPVSLSPGDLEDKLVRAGRGGYCFEQNLLLREALLALGAEVDMYLARVRVGAQPGTVRPRSHLVLRVQRDGVAWHADVGSGLGGPLEPLPWGPGEAHELAGWEYRVIGDGGELVLQSRAEGEWADLYGFVPEPVPLIDVETITGGCARIPARRSSPG